MRLTTLFFGLLLSFATFSTLAGSGHDHGHAHGPVDQETAKAKATAVVVELAKREKIDASWGSISASSVEQKVFKSSPEWVVVFVNDEISDPAGKTLYVFLTLGGDYIAANYTGE
ncbi:MAG: DUF6488 family protein [Gammaproteobacteria bacterium]|nr:DUF6488 family protein [Gammaproteobacteria bacterium]